MSCYSLDLRKKVILFLKDGNSIRKTANIFKISPRTISDWKARYKNNNLKPDSNSIRRGRKIDQEALESYIENNPNDTLSAIALKFNVYVNAIYYRVKKGKITYKKKSFYTKKEMKDKERPI